MFKAPLKILSLKKKKNAFISSLKMISAQKILRISDNFLKTVIENIMYQCFFLNIIFIAFTLS